MAVKNSGNIIFGKKYEMTVFSKQATHFVEITLYCTISMINVFLCFMLKFKMVTKNGGKMIFGKKCEMTLRTHSGPKTSSKLPYLAPFLRH